MKVQILSTAENEFRQAVDFYNDQCEGLGYEFASEVKQTIGRIVHFPEAWTPLSTRTRRCRIRRYPYGVVYQIRDGYILVVAIMHLRRHPDAWKPRLAQKDR
ncbi:MAG: type II toxin-antitoxin system RelE/ParE family toxin [Acidobacteria bacterium]|nr:type II toxin-antitoxin system RelE/ParE family toxin [Acidobacteriota bacterium]